MNKNKGFTLVELLVVIAIIGILAVLIVPSIMKVNNDINDRMLSQKIEYIETAGELYGTNNPDLFNGADEVTVPVWKLIEANYIEADKKVSDTGVCSSDNPNEEIKNKIQENQNIIASGCIIDPTNADVILNVDEVLLTKKPVGIVGKYQGNGYASTSTNETLVKKVCDGFEVATGNTTSEYDGYSSVEGVRCKCKVENGNITLINIGASGNEKSGERPEQCILVSNKESGSINNWLKYGSSSANWRVIGLYKIDGKVSAKMITSTVVDN